MRRILLLFGLLPLLTSCTTTPRPPLLLLNESGAQQQKEIGGGRISITFRGDSGALDRAAVDRWIDTAAKAVTTYFGRYPVKQVDLIVTFDEGNDIHDGVTHEGERIDISIGRKTSPAALGRDWMLTHEMFHLVFPGQDRNHHWMEEGLSTYLEPLARARIGNLSSRRLWLEVVQGMPNALPEAGDRGLNRTHTWGRTYWGGALFWLLADVHIREQTQNRKSLDTAIRAILDAGGDGSASWPASRVVEAGDAATGTQVLHNLYAQMALKPKTIDLDDLWKKLGIVVRGERVTFDDNAQWAAIRRSMTAKPVDH